MTPLESAILGILAVLLTGRIGCKSIGDEVMRTICCAATVTAYWILLVIAAKLIIAWLIADIFG